MNEYSEFMERNHIREVGLNDTVYFHCSQCGQCCRHLQGAVQADNFDIFRIARYLQMSGGQQRSIADVIDAYTEPVILEDTIPIFVLKTPNQDAACIFLKNGKCSIHDAKPHVCRLYPFGVTPDYSNDTLHYYLCGDKPHHFTGEPVKVKDWMARNSSAEDMDFYRAQNRIVSGIVNIVKILKATGRDHPAQRMWATTFYLYGNYDLSRPFMEQYWWNYRELMEELQRMNYYGFLFENEPEGY